MAFLLSLGDKMGRLTMHIMKHMQATTILAEQYLRERFRKAVGWMEDVFTHTLPDGANGPPKV